MGTARRREKKPKPAAKRPKGPGSRPRGKKVSPEALVKKAYAQVGKRLESENNGKVIDDLVKLMKLEKDLGGEQADVSEIKVRWESGEDESSSEE